MRYAFAIAAVLTFAGSAMAQTLASAPGFVQGLYAAYGHGSPDYAGRDAHRVFTTDLQNLIDRDVARTPKGDVGALDGDPICDCQDPDGLKLQSVSVVPMGAAGRARAIAHLKFPDGPRTVTLDLVGVGGDWRVADVHTADMPSLAKLLRDGH